MGERDAREVLGLPSGASEDDLKDAYRRLALRYHPDRNHGDEASAAMFREVNEAYAALKRDRRRPGGSPGGPRGGMGAEATCGFAFAAASTFEFAFPGGADTASCSSWRTDPPGCGTAGPGIPDHAPRSGGRAARRGAGLSASLCLVFGGVLIGVALPEAAPVFGARGPVRTAPSASSTAALAPAADAAGVAAAEDAPGLLCAAPAGGAPADAAKLPAGGAPLARAEAPAADVSADHAAALMNGAAAEQVPARPGEFAGGQNAAWAVAGLAGRRPAEAERSSAVPVARPAPPPLADSGAPMAGDRAALAATAEAAALFALLMRAGERAMELSDVVGARSHYERAAALDPASSTAAIAAGETYDPRVLSLAGATHSWLTDAAKAAAWYERARALGDPVAVGLLARLR